MWQVFGWLFFKWAGNSLYFIILFYSNAELCCTTQTLGKKNSLSPLSWWEITMQPVGWSWVGPKTECQTSHRVLYLECFQKKEKKWGQMKTVFIRLRERTAEGQRQQRDTNKRGIKGDNYPKDFWAYFLVWEKCNKWAYRTILWLKSEGDFLCVWWRSGLTFAHSRARLHPLLWLFLSHGRWR